MTLARNLSQRSLLTVFAGQESESIVSARYRWGCRDRGSAPFVILQWTRSGYGVYETPERTWKVPAEHAFVAIVPENAQYYYPAEATQPWSFAWINFYGELAIILWQAFRKQFGPVIPMASNAESTARLLEMIRDGKSGAARDRFGASTRAYAFYVSLLRELAEPPASNRDFIQAALDLMESTPVGRITVKELAAAAGLTREHFSRAFLRTVGCSPAEWLRNRRLDQAAALLASTSLPVTEVALRTGFCSARHLRHAFKCRFGHLPSETRAGKKSS